jgi:methylmalonyl-CoA mutase cobalamin-binding subunit
MKSYKGMFDHIVMVSPSAHTIQNKLMDTIPSEQRFDALTPEVFDKVEELTENAVEEDMHTLVVLDDVSSDLRKKEVENELNKLVKERK